MNKRVQDESQHPYCNMNNDIQHIRYAEKDALLYFSELLSQMEICVRHDRNAFSLSESVCWAKKCYGDHERNPRERMK